MISSALRVLACLASVGALIAVLGVAAVIVAGRDADR